MSSDPTPSPADSIPGSAVSPEPGSPAPSHYFDVQKEVHRRIRNDPDYDDWEYGTEPLPHEAWRQRPAADSQAE
ncbi:MAG: hypothetical protein ACKOZW_06930 [Cyanobium sp.]